MKMFSTQNDGEQITKLNSRVTDLHDAYRVLLQNVNRLQKEMDEKCSFKVHLQISDQVDSVENEQQRLETKMINDHQDLNWKIKQLENKLLDDDVAEYTSTNPGQIYLEAKEKFIAAKIDFLNTDIAYLEWSVRAANCLRDANIETVKDLCSYTERTLLKRKNLGTRTFIEMKSVLSKYNLKLREEHEND